MKYYLYALILFLSAFQYECQDFSLITKEIEEQEKAIEEYKNNGFAQTINDDDDLDALKYTVRTKEESLDVIQRKIENHQNVMIVFHAEWCGHCRRFIPEYDELSRYPLTYNFELIKIKCGDESTSNTCQHFNVRKYPTLKVFYKGVELSNEPSRDKKALIEYLHKLSSSSLVQLESKAGLKDFLSNYGESSFVIYNYDTSSVSMNTFKSCINAVSEDVKYKPFFYFGIAKDKSILNEYLDGSFKQGIALFHRGHISNFDGFNECSELLTFVSKNQFSIIMRMTLNFMRRLQDNKVTSVLITLPQTHMKKSVEDLKSKIKTLKAESNQAAQFVFTYLNVENTDDLKMIEFFKLSKEPYQVVLFNFANRKFTVEPQSEGSIEQVIQKLENYSEIDLASLKWISGNKIEDFISSLGVEYSNTVLLIIVLSILLLIFILMFACIYYCEECMTKPSLPKQQNNLTKPDQTGKVKKE